MAHSSQPRVSEKRKEEKLARKRENIERVESTKREKSVWEKLKDDKTGVKVEDTDSGEQKKTFKVRKVHTKNLISHHRGHGRRKSTVCVRNGSGVVRVKWTDAAKLVSQGGEYVNRSVWREFRDSKKGS